MKVILRSPFSPWTGYGRDGIGLAQALMERHHEVMLAPSATYPPLPRDVAGLLTEQITHADVALHHIEPHFMELLKPDALMARRNIAWTMWGFSELPDVEWVEQFPEKTKYFDYIVAYDPVSAKAFSQVVPAEKLLTIQGGYASEDWGPPDRSEQKTSDTFVFGMVGKLTPRKGVYDAFKAFWELKEDKGDEFNAALELYTIEPVFPEGVQLPPGVTHHVTRLLPPELKRLYWHFDTLLAPSMADAKHLPPIEALSCGCPVILSDIPGHRTWATDEMVTWIPTGGPVSFSPGKGFDGVTVDGEALKAAMWEHYTDRIGPRSKAMAAVSILPPMLDWTRCLERLGLATGTLL